MTPSVRLSRRKRLRLFADTFKPIFTDARRRRKAAERLLDCTISVEEGLERIATFLLTTEMPSHEATDIVEGLRKLLHKMCVASALHSLTRKRGRPQMHRGTLLTPDEHYARLLRIEQRQAEARSRGETLSSREAALEELTVAELRDVPVQELDAAVDHYRREIESRGGSPMPDKRRRKAREGAAKKLDKSRMAMRRAAERERRSRNPNPPSTAAQPTTDRTLN